MNGEDDLSTLWTIAVKHSVLDAAIALETEYGHEALGIADAEIDHAATTEDRAFASDVWRYLMAWNCMGMNDTAELVILPE